jgi:hypothetical protein
VCKFHFIGFSLSFHAKEKAAIRAKGRCPFIECIQWRDSRCTMVLTAEKPRYDLA